jgi:hypothetical protein
MLPFNTFMFWTQVGSPVETPLHPSTREWRRREILREGYAEHKRVLEAQERLRDQVRQGFRTIHEMREALYGS